MSGLDKTALRADMKLLREEAHARDPDAGETLAEKFPLKLLERYGPIVSGYWPIGSEIDPRPLMEKLAGAGATLCLPRVDDDGAMSFRLWSPGDPLEDRPFGLKEPLESAPRVQPTLILVPLLAFDKLGNRLGYGKGHYDRTLQQIRQDGRAFACGLGFFVQMLDELSAEPHDQPLDWAMTERGSVPIFMMRAFSGGENGGDGPNAA
ncbi:5-formyltetrahydrofolate cyclo-ligase [Henriciella sp. AS95]|uniref:5-formyltetrahydrofolate cyclo-ligase n=1 Tax=Henriciella sp. AS95 TaxID=3135782 RepID=UPI00317014B0